MYSFISTNGWINSCIKRSGLDNIKFHGESDDMTPEDRELLMMPWSIQFHQDCKKIGVTPNIAYDVARVGILYQKLPNSFDSNK